MADETVKLRHTAAQIDDGIDKANAAAQEVEDARGTYTSLGERLDDMGSGGGTSDAYTKAETDSLLDGKVDKETGKGLSANDFTDAYKAAVDGAAPQATTYTDAEVDALLTEKANADDVYTKQQVDDAIDSKESVSVSVVGDSLIFLIN